MVLKYQWSFPVMGSSSVKPFPIIESKNLSSGYWYVYIYLVATHGTNHIRPAFIIELHPSITHLSDCCSTIQQVAEGAKQARSGFEKLNIKRTSYIIILVWPIYSLLQSIDNNASYHK